MATLKAQGFEFEFSYYNLNSCNEIEYIFDIKWDGKPFFNPEIISKTAYSVKNGMFIISDCWDGEDWLHTFFINILKAKKGRTYATTEPPEWRLEAITWEDRRDEKEKSWEGKTVKTKNEQGEIIDVPYAETMKMFIPLWENNIEFKIGFPYEIFDTQEYTTFELSLTTTFSDLTKFLEDFGKEMNKFYDFFGDRIEYVGNGKYQARKDFKYEDLSLNKDLYLTKRRAEWNNLSVDTDNPLDNQLFVEFHKNEIDQDKVRLLIEQGANINATDEIGWNILWNYIFEREDRWKDNEDFFINLSEIYFLIDLGININYTHDGLNCLYLTIMAKDYETTKLLLEAGANPNCMSSVDTGGYSLLDKASDELGAFELKKWSDNDEAIWQLLVDFGAKNTENLFTNEINNFLTINASYSTGLLTEKGLINIENIPGISKDLVFAFNKWVKHDPDNNYHSEKIPDKEMPYRYRNSDMKTRNNIDFFKTHNRTGSSLARNIKEIVGKDVKVEYYYIKAEDLANEKGRNQGYLLIN